MDQDVARLGPCLLEELTAFGLGRTGLKHERLAKRVMAADQELVSVMQPFQERQFGDSGGFPVRPPVAVGAGEDEVPDPVDVRYDVEPPEGVRKEVVNVGVCGLDVAPTVEAPALLVAV